MATFTTTQPGASAGYMRYLWSHPIKTDKIQSADLLDFSLANIDSSFVKLKRGAYIDLSSVTYPHFFTGFVTNDPEPSYLGVKGGVGGWGYIYQATGDEYILSLKPMGLVRPFMNVHMGTILKRMINILCPGIFNVTNIQAGPLVAQYTIDPSQRFKDLSKSLCDASSYVFFGKNKSLYFMPQDDVTFPGVTLDGTNKHFTPSRLSLKPSSNPIINDAIVLGDVEPQKYMTEYFLGTGLQGTYPLAEPVFGVDTSILLQEDFTSTSIDSTLWSTNDNGTTLQVNSGYLNILGGSAYLQSLNPIPLEGHLRLTHGEWDFLSGSGVICGLYKVTPTSGTAGCVYGLNVAGTTLSPVVNGTVDTQTFTLDYSKRYVFRTVAEFSRMHRLAQPYSYIDSSGVVQVVGGQTSSCLVNWHTIITEVDPTTGKVTNQVTFINDDVTLDGTAIFATYVPVVSGGLHATVSGITVSTPVNATLAIATYAPILNSNFDDWESKWVPKGWAAYSNIEREDTWMDGPVYGCRLYTYPPEPNNPIYIQQRVSSFILPFTQYDFTIRARVNPGLTAGTLKITLTGTYSDGSLVEGSPECPALSVNVTTIPDFFVTLSGTLTTGMKEIPNDLNIIIELVGGSTGQYGAMWVDNLVVITPFVNKLLGPNEIDAMDGLAPIATITSGNTGAPTKDFLFGTSQYNAGQSQLVFFKDSVNRRSFAPVANQVVRLSYRSAGSAIGRVVSNSSVATEATLWGDDGHRSVIRQDLSPRPRSSFECELAAYAIVAENMYQHYDGTYQQFSPYFANEPRAGAIFQLINVPGIAPSFAAEQITQVTTTFECDKTSPEIFDHVITFSTPVTQLQKLEAAIASSVEYQKNNNTVINPPPVDLALIGLNFQDDVTRAQLVSWGPNQLNFDVGPVLSSVEVRLTDKAWGVGAAKNLLATTSSTFIYQLLNASRANTVYMKQV